MDEIKKIEIKTASENSFIGCWMIEDTELMDEQKLLRAHRVLTL